MTAINMRNPYLDFIEPALSTCLSETDLPGLTKYRGKVRDTYEMGDLSDRLILITTDRQSAFDRFIATVPFKGQVLNLTSAWWFEQTNHIIPNHMLAVPDPNVMIAKKCRVFPIELVVRGYITGTTNTSLWTQYQKGLRTYHGMTLEEGLVKNQRLAAPLLTPTTKEVDHDRPISPEAIVAENWMTQAEWDVTSQAALRLFEFGSRLAAERGLILVDTKYEFGRDASGEILLVDEIHTPDSSRYWLADSYASRFAQGLEPDNLDKESLRLWFAQQCDPYLDPVLPQAPSDLITHLSSRYIELYEKITGNRFHFPASTVSTLDRIHRHLAGWLA